MREKPTGRGCTTCEPLTVTDHSNQVADPHAEEATQRRPLIVRVSRNGTVPEKTTGKWGTWGTKIGGSTASPRLSLCADMRWLLLSSTILAKRGGRGRLPKNERLRGGELSRAVRPLGNRLGAEGKMGRHQGWRG